MILGHYAAALAGKRAAPRASLGTLMFAAQLVDHAWPIFLLLGIEQARVVPGLMAASPLDFVHYPWTHSLLAAVGWALVAGVLYFAARRYEAGAWIVAALVASHWFLDLPMHRPDLPLWPGSDARVGLGLWSSIPATLGVELGLLTVGLWIYLRGTRARDRIGSWGLAALVAVLALVSVGGVFGPPPGSERAVALGALALWLFVPWGWWVDRHRAVVE